MIKALGMLACCGFGLGCGYLAGALTGLPDPSAGRNGVVYVVAFGVTFGTWELLRKRLR